VAVDRSLGVGAEPEGGAAEVLEAANDRLRRSVAGVGRSKEARTSAALFFSVRPSVMTSLKAAGTSWLMEAISLVMS